jgi:molecular chaperone HscB
VKYSTRLLTAADCQPLTFALLMDFSRDYFELFGLVPAFGIDTEALNQAYRNLQADTHPDRHVHAGEAEQRHAAQWSSWVNQAYQTLKSPFDRALYMLQRQGIEAMDPSNTRMPTEFLVRQMEWRESLADAVAGTDLGALERLEAMTRSEMVKATKQLGELLDIRRDYAAAAEALRQYRFLDKFLADIDDAYEQLA